MRHAVKKYEVGSWRKFKNCCCSPFQRNGLNLTVIEPPEPGDIIWENLNLPKMERFKRQAIATLLAAVLIIGCFFSIVLIKWLKSEFLEGKRKEAEFSGSVNNNGEVTYD